MLADRAHQTLTLWESFSLSGIGMTVVFLELILLAVAIMLISKLLQRLTAKGDASSTAIIGSADGPTVLVIGAPTAPAVPAAPQTVAARSLVLHKVEEPTAAVLMALVAHQTGIAPERLDFKAIRLIEED